MRKTFAVGLAVAMLAIPAFAAEPQLQVSYATDASMGCDAIAAESGRMDQVIATANGQIGGADGAARGAGLASTVAVEGLARSGALGRVPGLGMFANQAANLARQRGEAVKAQAANTIQTANTRKALLAGLYSGKACDAPPAPPAAQAAEAAPAGV
ncbi:hypothetical protein [uncultured Phenylobacterium sp.]|uniref:hypothetical protein n=1 Tax=uncultured Phenylobacterium sp. TaxID=349273 RepID=UPI0025D8E498|nr:hypothetical protein [uncultured Phenylobacterium sp.]